MSEGGAPGVGVRSGRMAGGKPKPGDTCPYCKINFYREPWAAGPPGVVCLNCRNYAEQVKSEAASCPKVERPASA